MRLLEKAAIGLAVVSIVDRGLKLGLMAHFFGRRPPNEPDRWPSVTILQPVTRGTIALREAVEARAALEYPAPVQHVLICDASDAGSQVVCHDVATTQPQLDLRIILVGGSGAPPAPKLVKLQAGMPYATGEVICLMDDDVAPRRGSLRRLVACLCQPGVGASFGLACYAHWANLWSSLLSAYVNAYTLEDFITWSYLGGPVRVVGQMACYWRRALVRAGGFAGLESYLDDDFVLAQRLRQIGLRPVQAPVIYDVYDGAASWREYAAKFARWIVLPKQAMMPYLTARQRLAAFLATPATILLPDLLGALALISRRKIPLGALAGALGAFAAVQGLVYARYLQRRMPPRRWPLLIYVALVTPVHAILALFAGNEITWRGQRLRVYRDGRFKHIA